MKVALTGLAYVLGERAEDGGALLRDNPDWPVDEIQRVTGVSMRYIAGPGITAVDLAVEAARKVLPRDDPIGALILVTQSPDYFLPASACVVQDRLGLPTSCAAFDVNMGCSGFVYGLSIGGAMIESGICDNVLLICADTYSRYITADDRTCRPIFSDGAAAAMLSRSAQGQLGPFVLGTDGSGARNLMVANGAARNEGIARITMDGAKVFMFTMAKVPKAVEQLLQKARLTAEDVDLFIFHQASQVVIDNVARRLGLPASKMYNNVGRVGNLVSTSIPAALKDAEEAGLLRDGARIALVGFGVGWSWGACLVRWEHAK